MMGYNQIASATVVATGGFFPYNQHGHSRRHHHHQSSAIFNKQRRRQQQQQQQQQSHARTYSQQRHTSTTTAAATPQQQEMKDEYGEMTADGDSFVKLDFVLENKSILPQAQLRYQTYGQLNEAKDNVVVVCHALTGNASLHSWWGGLLGDGKAFDTSKHFVVCCNILGSCYGSTNPRSINPQTGIEYGTTFPDISVKDTVRLQLQLLQEGIGVTSIKTVIGGSFGGMQAVEFAVQGGITNGDFCTENGKSSHLQYNDYAPAVYFC
jgi:hypothetical protein